MRARRMIEEVAVADREALREAVRIGDESGPGIPAEEVFSQVRQLIARQREAAGK